MAHHEVEQAIYTSEKRQKMRGYQLVAQSPGITDDIARELSQWSPSHGAILDEERDAQCNSFFPVSPEKFAIGRTIYGLPEYSGRGGLQVYTHYLIVSREHLAGFDHNACKFWTVARSHGLMQWVPPQNGRLPVLPLIEHWALADSPVRKPNQPELVSSVCGLLASGRRVAVIEPCRPLALLKCIVGSIDRSTRLDLSFGIGLKPSAERPYKLQILPTADFEIRAALSREQISIARFDDSYQLN